jgi:hypothetical protein
MGSVLRFPAERVRGTLYPVERPQSAAILILPVIQIERAIDPAPWPEEWPDDGPAAPGFDAAPPRANSNTNGRRRRSPRS